MKLKKKIKNNVTHNSKKNVSEFIFRKQFLMKSQSKRVGKTNLLENRAKISLKIRVLKPFM
jgi:hypothetical protein